MELRVGNRYRLGRKIGSGSFGDIYLGEVPLPWARGHRAPLPPGPSGPRPGDPAPGPRHPRPRPGTPQRPGQRLAAFPASGPLRPPPRAPAPPSGRGVAGRGPRPSPPAVRCRRRRPADGQRPSGGCAVPAPRARAGAAWGAPRARPGPPEAPAPLGALCDPRLRRAAAVGRAAAWPWLAQYVLRIRVLCGAPRPE